MMMSLFIKAQTASPSKSITISKLTAYEKDNRFNIEWSADGGSETHHWEIQNSNDGKKFSTIAFILGPDPSAKGEEYRYKENWIAIKISPYYRVVHTSNKGVQQQSEMIKPVKNKPGLLTRK